MDPSIRFLQDLAVIMAAAAVAGLICKRAGLSPVVGYLVAGVVIGPFTPPHALVTDVERVRMLAQLGMVFLMFGVGLEFSLRRMRQLGLSVLAVTALTAIIVFDLGRIVAGLIGLDRAAGVFYAALLLSSSSAVIGKVLTESGRTHEKSCQLALGITLSEDIVAIVMLALLGSYVRFGGRGAPEGAGVLGTVGLFGGFVLLLAVLGLLIVPRVLKRLSREASTELETIFVVGLLLGLSLMVVKAGYSLALGAFLFGAIVAETPQRAHVERAFGGLHSMFATIFFVAIGMTIDVRQMPEAIVPVLGLTGLALIGRIAAAGLALLLLGYDTRLALRTAIIVTPIGEFGFIIGQLGTDSGILPKEYMTAVVGASLLTALVSPVLIRHNDAIAERLAAVRIPLLGQALAWHRRILDAIQKRRASSLLWRLTRKRLIQIAVEVAFVTAALIFAEPVIDWTVAAVGREVVPEVNTALVCWVALGLLLLAPLIAVWRNLQALAMILADYATQNGPGFTRTRAVIAMTMQAGAMIALLLWWWNFVPVHAGLWLTLAVLAFLAAMAAVLWRRMIRWHSEAEITLESSLGQTPAAAPPSYEWADRYAPWGLEIGEVVLPDPFGFAGRSIGEIGVRKKYGCSIVGIERLSFMVANPGPGSHLFPGDRLLLLGTDEQIAAAREALTEDRAADHADTFRDLTVELAEVPADSPAAGKTLMELNWPRLLGVQIVGHERAGARLLTPPADLHLLAGDQVLALGTPEQVNALRQALLPAVSATAAEATKPA